LMLAWRMYADDNNDLLAPNDFPYLTPYYSMSAVDKAKNKNWVVGTMEQAADAQDHAYAIGAGISELLDPNTVISAYLPNRAVWRCPADTYIDPNAGHSLHVRSYSMNSAVGTVFGSSSTSGRPIGSPVDGGWLEGASYVGGQGVWLTYGKMSAFSNPGPVNTWVMMDENPYTINDGSFAVSAQATAGHTYLIDYPSAAHAGSGGMAFADGHASVHKWKDPRTYTPQGIAQPGMGSTTATVQTPDNPDCFYLAPLTSALR